GRVPVLDVSGDRLFLAWIEETGTHGVQSGRGNAAVDRAVVMGAWLDGTGHFLEKSFPIAEASRTTWNLNTDVRADGRITLVFDAQIETRASELYLSVIDEQTVVTTRVSGDDGWASKYPDFAYGVSSGALVWFDEKDGNNEIYLSVFDLSEQLSLSELCSG